MKFKSLLPALLVTLSLIKGSSLIAQVECHLLDWPYADAEQDLRKLAGVLDLLNSSKPPIELALLSEQQRHDLASIKDNFNALGVDAASDEPRDLEAAANKTSWLQNRAAPQVLEDLERVLGDQWPSVVFVCNRNLARGFRDPSGFTLKPVIEGLKLTAEQKTQLEKSKSKLEANQKKLNSELAEKLKSLLDDHFAAVKAELDSLQQTRFLKWFGELKLFKSLAFSDRYRDTIRRASSQRGDGGVIENTRFFDDDGKPIQPAAIRKDFEIDSLLYCVLTMQNIEDQLNLSSDQVQQIKQQIHGNDIRLVMKNRRTERMLAILDDKWELPEWLDKILLPHQKTWMLQFEFQVYNLPYADSFGLLHPDVSESLKLTDAQKERIKKTALDYRTKVADLSRKTQRAIALAEKENRAKMLQLLNPEQMHQYRLWFGDMPIDP